MLNDEFLQDLDVQTSVMEGAMSQTTATNIPQVSNIIIIIMNMTITALIMMMMMMMTLIKTRP